MSIQKLSVIWTTSLIENLIGHFKLLIAAIPADVDRNLEVAVMPDEFFKRNCDREPESLIEIGELQRTS